eukprot:CAMPEP_0174257192 /NCGR_PEP_ID=MMETSP0439-20130205/6367_1 /TAXON_ID=0 /ORGANISM="Stereomyxa ramosa, Strain Chinc5" /LENGTH=127 /DNA_ID=CAMNT_0015340177 /DNA_START=33 /DNA_END=416 /DNA_ORIENTATION=+
MNAQKLARLQQGVRIGGKGSVRRKTKARRKRQGGTDDKRLQMMLKKLGAQPMPGIEEVNLFREDGSVIQFSTPRFQVSGAANMYVVSGRAENKKIQDILPSFLAPTDMGDEESDDDVPDLIDNFEES